MNQSTRRKKKQLFKLIYIKSHGKILNSFIDVPSTSMTNIFSINRAGFISFSNIFANIVFEKIGNNDMNHAYEQNGNMILIDNHFKINFLKTFIDILKEYLTNIIPINFENESRLFPTLLTSDMNLELNKYLGYQSYSYNKNLYNLEFGKTQKYEAFCLDGSSKIFDKKNFKDFLKNPKILKCLPLGIYEFSFYDDLIEMKYMNEFDLESDEDETVTLNRIYQHYKKHSIETLIITNSCKNFDNSDSEAFTKFFSYEYQSIIPSQTVLEPFYLPLKESTSQSIYGFRSPKNDLFGFRLMFTFTKTSNLIETTASSFYFKDNHFPLFDESSEFMIINRTINPIEFNHNQKLNYAILRTNTNELNIQSFLEHNFIMNEEILNGIQNFKTHFDYSSFIIFNGLQIIGTILTYHFDKNKKDSTCYVTYIHNFNNEISINSSEMSSIFDSYLYNYNLPFSKKKVNYKFIFIFDDFNVFRSYYRSYFNHNFITFHLVFKDNPLIQIDSLLTFYIPIYHIYLNLNVEEKNQFDFLVDYTQTILTKNIENSKENLLDTFHRFTHFNLERIKIGNNILSKIFETFMFIFNFYSEIDPRFYLFYYIKSLKESQTLHFNSLVYSHLLKYIIHLLDSQTKYTLYFEIKFQNVDDFSRIFFSNLILHHLFSIHGKKLQSFYHKEFNKFIKNIMGYRLGTDKIKQTFKSYIEFITKSSSIKLYISSFQYLYTFDHDYPFMNPINHSDILDNMIQEILN